MGELTVENLTKNYGDIVALNKVNLKVNTGEVFVLLGPNGAGKTTLLKIIVGILKPTNGFVKLDGYDIVQSPEDAKRIIGYLPENPSLYTGLTVTEFLQFVGKIRSVPDDQLDARIRESLGTFDIKEKKDELVGSLSKGTKQKVALIASSLHDSHFLVLDEPLNVLDP
jgi:ABC-2 type transport system ATP-binding protein